MALRMMHLTILICLEVHLPHQKIYRKLKAVSFFALTTSVEKMLVACVLQGQVIMNTWQSKVTCFFPT
jgi:hypothetical protein